MSANGLNTGAIVSTTVTLNCAFCDALPSGSEAVHVTVVVGLATVAIGNSVFGRGVHDTVTPAGAPPAGSSMSVAVGGIKNTFAPHLLVASATMSLGTVTMGAPV